MLVHQPLDRHNPDQLSGDFREGIKPSALLTSFETVGRDKRLSEHHYRHVVVEPTPGSALKLVSAQHLLDIAVILFDRPPKMRPLDEVLE